MTQTHQDVAQSIRTPKVAIFALLAIFVTGITFMGFEQGEILSLVHGQSAYDDMFFHELSHDIRHLAGFPCH